MAESSTYAKAAPVGGITKREHYLLKPHRGIMISIMVMITIGIIFILPVPDTPLPYPTVAYNSGTGMYQYTVRPNSVSTALPCRIHRGGPSLESG